MRNITIAIALFATIVVSGCATTVVHGPAGTRAMDKAADELRPRGMIATKSCFLGLCSETVEARFGDEPKVVRTVVPYGYGAYGTSGYYGGSWNVPGTPGAAQLYSAPSPVFPPRPAGTGCYDNAGNPAPCR